MTTIAQRLSADAMPGPSPFMRATVVAAEVVAIPADWAGKYVRFHATTQAVGVRFGTAGTVSVSLTAVSTLPDGVPTVAATTPHFILDAGDTEHVRINPAWTHFAHIAGADTGYLCFTMWSGDGN